MTREGQKASTEKVGGGKVTGVIITHQGHQEGQVERRK